MSNEIEKINQMDMMAQRLSVEPGELSEVIFNSVMPAGKQVSNAQVITFLALANQYGLNPMAREVYAFPAKGGEIQTIVGIDGWLTILNNNPQFDGMDVEFSQSRITIGGKDVPEYCKVIIYRKDRNRPVVAIEYMEECHRGTDPWKQKPRRMLQHKATIQAARYAFGMSGIIDEDEAERYQEAGLIEKDITPQPEPAAATQSNTLNSILAEQQAQAVHPDTTSIEENHDPIVAADTYSKLMEEASSIEDLEQFYDEGIGRLRELYKHWKAAVDMDKANLCGDLSRTLQAVAEECKVKLLTEAGA